jgi:uncharacterized protein
VPTGRARPEGALRIRVTDLRRRIGSREDVEATTRLGGLSVGDVVVADDPVVLRASVEALSDGVRVEGTVRFGWSGPCRRCLGEASGTSTATVSELFADHPADEEVLPLEDGWADLTEAVRDTVLLGLPLAPLCRPDCPGPAPGEFPVATAPGEAEERPADPRWAALAELRFDPDAD